MAQPENIVLEIYSAAEQLGRGAICRCSRGFLRPVHFCRLTNEHRNAAGCGNCRSLAVLKTAAPIPTATSAAFVPTMRIVIGAARLQAALSSALISFGTPIDIAAASVAVSP
jgi:hypothetical protein